MNPQPCEIKIQCQYHVKRDCDGNATHVIYPFATASDPGLFPFEPVMRVLTKDDKLQFVAIGSGMWDALVPNHLNELWDEIEMISYENSIDDLPFLKCSYLKLNSEEDLCIAHGRYHWPNRISIGVAMLYSESADSAHVGIMPLNETEDAVMRKLAEGAFLDDLDEVELDARLWETIYKKLNVDDLDRALSKWTKGKYYMSRRWELVSQSQD